MKILLVLLAFFLSACSTVNSSKPFVPAGVIYFFNDQITDKEAMVFVYNLKTAIDDYDEKREITIYIDSPGGYVNSGKIVIEAIKAAKNRGYKVNTVCSRLCASMAAMIHQFGSKRLSFSTSLIMFHHAYSRDESGEKIRDKSVIANEHSVFEEVAVITGIPEKDWNDRFDLEDELWYSGKDALRAGLVDGLVNLPLQDVQIFQPY